MNDELTEQLTIQFYEWEQRGRGWDVWNFPVYPEPPFVPFFFHNISNPMIDDGRKQTFFSSLIDDILEKFNSSQSNQSQSIKQEQEVTPQSFIRHGDIQEIQVSLPHDKNLKAEYFEQCLITLPTSLISFEIIGSKENITIQFACRKSDISHITQQLKAYFPECILTIANNSFPNLFNSNECAVVDFGLSDEFMRPIKTYNTFIPDPFTSLLGAMEQLEDDEIALFQVLFSPAEKPWAPSIVRSVVNYDGDSFFADAPEMVKFAHEKCSHPLFAVNIRVLGKGETISRSWDIARSLIGSIGVYEAHNSNKLIPLINDDYNLQDHITDVIERQTHRSGMILNIAELISFVHFPSVTIESQKLRGKTIKNVQAPFNLLGNEYVLGVNIQNDVSKNVSLNEEQRLRHIHIIGATGTGKSTLLRSLVTQDIERGLGITVLDPHGDLIESILEQIPPERFEDVIVFDPSDEMHPIGFNILEAKTEVEKNVLSSDLVEIFKRFSTSWGDQMSVVLGNAISAFLENSRVGSLMDLRRFLIEKDFREEILCDVLDRHVSYFWEKEYPLLRGSALSSILTRLDFFLRPKLIRNIVSQTKGIDLKEIVNQNKILLVKLSQGIIGDENAYLLGSLLVSKLHQVVMQRQLQSSHDRTPFYLYIDEFQNFITPSMKTMLSGARKYHMGLVLAHQDLHQLWETDTGLANSIISNAGTRICFRVGDFDAQKLESGFTHFDSNDLQNLSIGEAIVRVERSDYDFSLKTFLPDSIDKEESQKTKKAVIDLSRKKYGSVPTVIERSKQEPQMYSMPQPQIKKETHKKESIEIQRRDSDAVRMQGEDQKNITYHRYLQTLIKRLAEQRGYKAVIEEQTVDKLGRVDVGLERDGEKIACEICVTTNNGHEIKNIEKCLQSGYQKILFCSPEKKRLDSTKKSIRERLQPDLYQKIFFFLPDELALFFENETRNTIKEQGENIVKGYRVKVEYKTISEAQKKEKQKVVSGVVVNALRRLKEIRD